MRKTKIITRSVEETEDIICNMCGKSCFGGMNYNGLIEVSVSGGYDSTALEDGVRYTFSICEDCLKEYVFDKCMILPETEDRLEDLVD